MSKSLEERLRKKKEVSDRVIHKEILLLRRGLVHDSSNGKVKEITNLSKRQRTIEQKFDLVIKVPVKKRNKNRRCPNCDSVTKPWYIRCIGCSAILDLVTEELITEVRIERGRVNGKRPKCVKCDTGISQRWEECKGCGVRIVWTVREPSGLNGWQQLELAWKKDREFLNGGTNQRENK